MSIDQAIVAPTVRRIPVLNVWHMLVYAWDLAAYEALPDSSSEDAPELLGLLAHMLVCFLERLQRRQPMRSHSHKSEWVEGVRGRINFSVTAKHVKSCFGQLYCEHPELSVDSIQNRIVKSTLQKLVTDDRIMHQSKELEVKLRQRVWAAYRAMEGITLIRITAADFRKLQLSSSERSYRLPLQICKLLHYLQMPKEEKGDTLLNALLSDEVSFSKVFEKFVRNFYAHHLDAKVMSEILDWPCEQECSLLPQMVTDTTIEIGRPAHRRIVIETKYYFKTLAARFDGHEKFHSSNMYQLYAYLLTQEAASELHQRSEGILLYPTVSIALDEPLVIQGHRLRVATLDLSQPWRQIHSRLLELVS